HRRLEGADEKVGAGRRRRGAREPARPQRAAARGGEAVMKNDSFVRKAIDRRGLATFTAATLACVLVAAAALFHLWIRTRVPGRGARVAGRVGPVGAREAACGREERRPLDAGPGAAARFFAARPLRRGAGARGQGAAARSLAAGAAAARPDPARAGMGAAPGD